MPPRRAREKSDFVKLGDAQKLRRHLWWPWADGVVPFRVEGVGVEVEGCHLLVGDFDALWVGGGVESAADGQAGLGGGVADECADGDATDERRCAPSLGDVAEHAVLYFVPLRCSGRIVADLESQPGGIGQRLQFEFP